MRCDAESFHLNALFWREVLPANNRELPPVTLSYAGFAFVKGASNRG